MLNTVCCILFLPFGIVGFGHIWKRRDWTIYCLVCHCWFFWSRRCLRARWDGWRSCFDVSWIHPGLLLILLSLWSDRGDKVLKLYIPMCAILLQVIFSLQSFMAGLAASGALTSGLRLITKAAFEDFHSGLRKGTSM